MALVVVLNVVELKQIYIMKIRSSFVPNSSNSSFAIKLDKNCPDVYELAKKMIKIREWDDDIDLIKKVNVLKKKNKSNINIFFRTCNYDTYLTAFEGYVFIETCNNHNWYELDIYDENVTKNISDEILEKVLDDPENFKCGEFGVKNDFEYYSLEYGFKIKKANDYNYCSDCSSELYNINGYDACPVCKKDKDGNIVQALFRKNKMKKLLKK